MIVPVILYSAIALAEARGMIDPKFSEIREIVDNGHKVPRCLTYKLRGVPPKDRLYLFTKLTDSGCWEWLGHCDRKGYGRTTHRGKVEGAHRASYIEFVGPIPAGLQIDHLCRNRKCINPSHLEAVTPRENVLRGLASDLCRELGRAQRRTHCHRGHEYSASNAAPLKSGYRYCRACRKIRDQKLRERRSTIRQDTNCAVSKIDEGQVAASLFNVTINDAYEASRAGKIIRKTGAKSDDHC